MYGQEYNQFRCESIRLAKLDAEEYFRKGTMLGVGLAALMDRRKVGEPLGLRALMMQRVAESERDDAEKFLLLNVIETYFKLAVDDKESFSKLLSKEKYREAREMEVTWADKIREEGLLQGKRDTLLRLMTSKFGPIPGEIVTHIQGLESLEELDTYLERLLTASSLTEMRLDR